VLDEESNLGGIFKISLALYINEIKIYCSGVSSSLENKTCTFKEKNLCALGMHRGNVVELF